MNDKPGEFAIVLASPSPNAPLASSCALGIINPLPTIALIVVDIWHPARPPLWVINLTGDEPDLIRTSSQLDTPGNGSLSLLVFIVHQSRLAINESQRAQNDHYSAKWCIRMANRAVSPIKLAFYKWAFRCTPITLRLPLFFNLAINNMTHCACGNGLLVIAICKKDMVSHKRHIIKYIHFVFYIFARHVRYNFDNYEKKN